MKPRIEKQTTLWNANELDERILENAAAMDEEDSAPEITKGSAELVAWDEPLEALGHQVPNLLSADEQTLTERLVLAGDEEADTELREASNRAAKA
jgi:hypothetical protein